MLDASKVRGDFFKPGKSHVCRFCGVPIQKLFKQGDKQGLLPLGNYCMWTLTLDNGINMGVNSCKDCRDQFDHNDAELCAAVLDSNLAAWAIKGEPLDKIKVKMLGNSKVAVLPIAKVDVDFDVDALGVGKLQE